MTEASPSLQAQAPTQLSFGRESWEATDRYAAQFSSERIGVDGAPASGTPPTMPHQWQRNTKILVDSSQKAQVLSTQQRVLTFGTQRAVDEKIININQQSTSALRRNIAECESLKIRAEKQLEFTLRETSLVEDELHNCEALMEKMKELQPCVEEGLAVRRRRAPREQTRDAVERALNEQLAGCKHSIRKLTTTTDDFRKDLAQLKICRQKLEEDIETKSMALEVDREALQLELGYAGGTSPVKSPLTSSYAAAVVSSDGASALRSSPISSVNTVARREQRTENLCEECERVRLSCERHRAKARVLQEETEYMERETRQITLQALSRKMDETERLKGQLEDSLHSMTTELATMEDSRASVEQSINDFQGPLSLAASRLSIRSSKPGVEVVRDSASRLLEKEMLDIEHSIRRLQLEMARQTAEILRLEQTRARLEADIKDKADALSLEQECETLIQYVGERLGLPPAVIPAPAPVVTSV